MSYISFDKSQLINLSYALNKEIIRSNRTGAYANSTIIGCNTRKYHGLLVAPQPQIDHDNHVLLSTLDESIEIHGAVFNLGIHKYPGIYSPKGHKYLEDYHTEPIPTLCYRIGSVLLLKEKLLMEKEDRTLVKYTLQESDQPIKLRLSPFLAFRNYHQLSKANIHINKKFDRAPNGISLKPYEAYDSLYMQLSRENDYVHVPEWYYNIEYIEERDRGYPYQEDLFVPGFFEVELKKGESVVFAAGLGETNPAHLSKVFTAECKKRIPRDSFENCLINAAGQFVVRREDRTEVTAGFPWFGRWGRDTLIALPGISLALGETKTMKSALETLVKDMKGPLFPNVGQGQTQAMNSVDAPMWFFWTIYEYQKQSGKTGKVIWKEFGTIMKQILEGYRKGTDYNIHMEDSGLIYAGRPDVALTWMDAMVDGIPVTPRTGYQVEINALWYHAVCYSIELAKQVGEKDFVKDWEELPNRIKQSFLSHFWISEKGYLADYLDEAMRPDISVRPNQVFATSLPYRMPSPDQCASILEKVKSELLTPRGLRTLAPKNPQYKGVYQGDQRTRDAAYHQGTVWPWLTGHFAEGWLHVYGAGGMAFVSKLYRQFEGVMLEHGVSTISEIYDGDPPHNPKGACSQAWSVSEVFRIGQMIKNSTTDSP
jgi:predicted glycogen debranching enzyme